MSVKQFKTVLPVINISMPFYSRIVFRIVFSSIAGNSKTEEA